jgi:hypothetical protein
MHKEYGNGTTTRQDKIGICEERRIHTNTQGTSPDLGTEDQALGNPIGQAAQGIVGIIPALNS